MSSNIIIDATLFMGMNSSADEMRHSCKSFIISHLSGSVLMPLEQVGRCDDIVWEFDRITQDIYYPFMDNLHTDMDIQRHPYDEADLRMALDSPDTVALPTHERLLIAAVRNRGGTLYTVSPRLRNRRDLPVQIPAVDIDAKFPAQLEKLYQESLSLRVHPADL